MVFCSVEMYNGSNLIFMLIKFISIEICICKLKHKSSKIKRHLRVRIILYYTFGSYKPSLDMRTIFFLKSHANLFSSFFTYKIRLNIKSLLKAYNFGICYIIFVIKLQSTELFVEKIHK